LEAERQRLSLELQDTPLQDGTMSMSSMIALTRDRTANAAGSKSTEEDEDIPAHCPILGGKPRAIYAQSLRPMYVRKDQGTLQTSSGKSVTIKTFTIFK